MSEEQVAEFVDLLNFEDDYEILNVYPFTIRRKRGHYVVKESLFNTGYVRVVLNGKNYLKHVLVAKQFLHNDDPEHLTQVDHISRDRSDYHLSNLRFVSPSENCKNKSSHNGVDYNYVDDIDGDSIVIDDYGQHRFEEHYYDTTVDKFFFWNGVKYRELHINEDKRNGSKFVHMYSTENKKVKVFISKFKKLYGIK